MKTHRFLLTIVFSVFLTVAFPAAAQDLILLNSQIIADLPIDRPLGEDEEKEPGKWSYLIFDPDEVPAPVRYEIVEDREKGRVLRASAEGGASLFYMLFKDPINLDDTPFLTFDWRIDEAPASGPDETEKSGDDFAFRIYLLSGGFFSSNTLNLVRAREKSVGSTWDSPYAIFLHKVKMHTFANAEQPIGKWRRETINVADLWRKTFDDDPQVHSVGFMADSDNAGGKVVAFFREIKLSGTAAE